MSLNTHQRTLLCSLLTALHRSTHIVCKTQHRAVESKDDEARRIFASATPCWEQQCALNHCRLASLPLRFNTSVSLTTMLTVLASRLRLGIIFWVVRESARVEEYVSRPDSLRKVFVVVCETRATVHSDRSWTIVGYRGNFLAHLSSHVNTPQTHAANVFNVCWCLDIVPPVAKSVRPQLHVRRRKPALRGIDEPCETSTERVPSPTSAVAGHANAPTRQQLEEQPQPPSAREARNEQTQNVERGEDERTPVPVPAKEHEEERGGEGEEEDREEGRGEEKEEEEEHEGHEEEEDISSGEELIREFHARGRPCPSVRLLPHQKLHTETIVNALRTYKVAFDTSDTGCGKTYVACAAAEALRASCIVVVCTNNIVNMWNRILKRFAEMSVVHVSVPKSVSAGTFTRYVNTLGGLEHTQLIYTTRNKRVFCLYFDNDFPNWRRAMVYITGRFRGADVQSAKPFTAKTYLVTPYTLLTRTATQSGHVNFVPARVDMYEWSGRGKLTKKQVSDWKVTLRHPLKEFAEHDNTLLIFDETHRAKNKETQTSHAVMELIRTVRRHGGWVLHSSATPFDQVTQLPHYLEMVTTGQRMEDLIGTVSLRLRWTLPGASTAVGTTSTWSPDEIMRKAMQCGASDATLLTCMHRLVVEKSVAPGLLNVIKAMITLEGNLQHLVDWQMDDAARIHNELRRVSTGAFALDRITYATLVSLLFMPFTLNRGYTLENVMTVLTRIMPAVIFTMPPFKTPHTSRDVELYLEKVNVNDIIVESAYLPEYVKYNTAPYPAPLTSSTGKAVVDERVVMSWKDDETWRLGSIAPVHEWERVVQTSITLEQRQEAQQMLELCQVAHSLNEASTQEGSFGWLRRDAGGAIAEVGEEGQLADRTMNARQKLELIKVASLANIVDSTLKERTDVKIVVMFNFKSPLAQFVQILSRMRPDAKSEIRVVTGDTPRKERDLYVDEFNARGHKVRVLCCIIQVMMEGVSLHDTHGNEPRISFIMANDSAQMTHQAKGRIFRAGSRSDASNYVVYGGFTLGGDKEKKLIERLSRKKQVMDLARSARSPEVYTASKIKTFAEYTASIRRLNAHVSAATAQTRCEQEEKTGHTRGEEEASQEEKGADIDEGDEGKEDERPREEEQDIFGARWCTNEFIARTWHVVRQAQQKRDANMLFRTFLPLSTQRPTDDQLSRAQLSYCFMTYPQYVYNTHDPLSTNYVLQTVVDTIRVVDIEEEEEDASVTTRLMAKPGFFKLSWHGMIDAIARGEVPIVSPSD